MSALASPLASAAAPVDANVLEALAEAFDPPSDPRRHGGCHVNALAFTEHCLTLGLDAHLVALNYPRGFDPQGADESWRSFLAVGQLIHYLTRIGDLTVDFNACQLEPVSGPQVRPLVALQAHWGLARDLATNEILWRP